MSIFLYHKTSSKNAHLIIKSGFEDGTGSYMTDAILTGVFFSDTPDLTEQEGAGGDALLIVEVDCDWSVIADCEMVEEAKKPYREWIIPAAFVNQRQIAITLRVA